MNNITADDERLKIHIENRNKILFDLQQVYRKSSYRHSSNADNITRNLSKTKGELYSPVIEDLLMEMNGKGLRRFDGNNNADCYRCKHFLNIPSTLSETREKILVCAEEYEADLNFVQAIVWLKSATTFMKDVSVEQFHLVFHKQWSNDRSMGKDSMHRRNSISSIQERDYESSSWTNRSNHHQEDNNSFDGGTEYSSSIDLLRNIQPNEKYDASQSLLEQQLKQNEELFIGKINSPSIFGSSQSLNRFFSMQGGTQNEPTLNNHIISDSDKEYSSSSDMFKDSQDEAENGIPRRSEKHYKPLEGSDLIAENSIEEFLLTSRGSNPSLKTFLKAKRDLAVTSDECDSSASDITVFRGERFFREQNSGCSSEYTRISQPNKQTVEQHARACDSNLHNKRIAGCSSNRIDNVGSPQRDSDYDTYQLSGDHVKASNCILPNEDAEIFSSQKIENITPYQKDMSAYETHDLEFLTLDVDGRDWISDKNQRSSLSSHKRESDESTSSIKIDYGIRRDNSYCLQNRYSQRKRDSMEDREYKGRGKRRKLEYVRETDDTVERNVKGEEKISSEWLKFTLNALSADEVAFQSLKMILSVFENERIARQYMGKRCWKNSLEEVAANTILDFRDVFETENKSNVCTREIVQAVTNTLDKCIGNTELNKVTVFNHQVSIILELCTSAQVCIETINYLTARLKSYEDILISLMNGKKADVHNIINQLHVILYALNICLLKYQLIFPNKNDQFEEEMILPVVDLWKNQLQFEGVMVNDSMKTRERRWLMILDDFTVIAAENFTQITEKSRTLVNLLAREK